MSATNLEQRPGGAPAKPTMPPRQRKALRTIVGCGAATCLALSAAGYFFGVEPALAALAAREATESELAGKRQQIDEATRKLSATRRRLGEAGREVAALPLRLEPASAVNRRLNRLAEVAAAAGVSVDVMQPGAAVDGTHYGTVPIRVAGNGPYPACAAFLHAVRAQFPDVTIQAFEAVNAAPSRDGNAATFRVDLAWHTTPGRK